MDQSACISRRLVDIIVVYFTLDTHSPDTLGMSFQLLINTNVKLANRMAATQCIVTYRHHQEDLLKFKGCKESCVVVSVRDAGLSISESAALLLFLCNGL